MALRLPPTRAYTMPQSTADMRIIMCRFALLSPCGTDVAEARRIVQTAHPFDRKESFVFLVTTAVLGFARPGLRRRRHHRSDARTSC